MEISAQDVMALREKTGAGIMDCKKALAETGGDVEKAVEHLRKTGILKAAKKADRPTGEGLIASYVHAGDKLAVLVEINCETDFVGRNEEFLEFAEDVAMQIAAMSPRYVKSDEIPDADKASQREIFIAQAKESGKPDHIAEKMVEGRMKKWAKEVCLYDQPFIRETEKTVDELRTALVAKTGENISVRRFVRFEVGEGIEKKKSDLAAEVAAEMAKFE